MILATLSTQVATTRYGKCLAGLPVDAKTAELSSTELLEKLVANMAGNLSQIMHDKLEEAAGVGDHAPEEFPEYDDDRESGHGADAREERKQLGIG
jgi:hypothetical protein